MEKKGPRGAGILVAILAIASLGSCSINRIAVRAVADALTGAGDSRVFTGDEDPELVGDALPFALKMYESLLEQLPDHEGLNLTTGSIFVMYANAFVQTPAELLTPDRPDERTAQLARAKRLYLRGERLLLGTLERKYPGIRAALASDSAGPILAKAKKPDVPFLYWGGASIMAALALDPLDIGLALRIKEVRALMARAYALDPDFGGGSIDDFYISFYGSLPSSLGGDKSLAKKHFAEALRKGGGTRCGPYVSYAAAISVPNQDYPEFKRLLEAALAIDASADASSRLANVIAQRRASSLLARKEDLFIAAEEE